jgi:flagellin-like protein
MDGGSMRKLVRSRKALSPVLSTVLMILVTIVGMSVLFAFFVNYARDFQLGSGSAVRESLVMEDVWFIQGENRVEVYVYNVGKVNFKIAAFYVNDKWEPFSSDPEGVVPVGDYAVLSVSPEDLYFLWDRTYDFKIVTERGSAFGGSYKWEN